MSLLTMVQNMQPVLMVRQVVGLQLVQCREALILTLPQAVAEVFLVYTTTY